LRAAKKRGYTPSEGYAVKFEHVAAAIASLIVVLWALGF